MWTPIVPVSPSLLDHMVEPAARSLALACFAGLALAALRVKAVSLRRAVWRGVLVAALAMPLLGLFAPQIRLWVPVPQFDARATAPAAALDQPVLRGGNQAAIVAPDGLARVDSAAVNGLPLEEAAPAPLRHAHPLPWALVLMCSYLSIALLLLSRVFAGAVLAHRLARSAVPIGDAAALRELAACCRRMGLKSQPPLAESENVLVPVTVRVRRAAILLPCSWRAWENDKLAAVIAHEVSHIQRRDPLAQRLALIHRAIFWFSPLGWWLERHLAGLAEQASDEAALSCGVERARYAEMLLGFVASLQNARSRISWEGVAMAKCSRAEKRIDRILAWRNAMPNELKKSLIVALAVLAAPVIALTASVQPSIYHFSDQEQAAPPAPQAPAPPAEPTPATHPVVKPGPLPQAPPAASALPRSPAPAPAPQAPAASPTAPSPAPLPPLAAGVNEGVNGGVSGGVPGGVAAPAALPQESDNPAKATAVFDNGSGLRFAIITKEAEIGSGAPDADALRSKIHGDFIWFEHDGKPYIIRDPATIDRAIRLWKQQRGQQQQALEQQQALLGQTQANMARKMEQDRVTMPDLSAQMDKLAAEMKQLSSNGATLQQLTSLQAQMGELQSRIAELQSHIAVQQDEMAREQAGMGSRQADLANQQAAIAEQQKQFERQAAQQMKQLLDEALAKGLAQPQK